MKKLELAPTRDNLIETLERDLLDRNRDIAMLYGFLQQCDYSSSISVDGLWGSGKTFFVKQTDLVINALNPMSKFDEHEKKRICSNIQIKGSEEASILSIYYDAWENDADSNPLYSLVFSICKELGIKYDFKDDFSFLKTAACILDIATGRDFKNTSELFKSENPLVEFSKEKDIQTKLHDFFSEILIERGNRLIIFVDELDRCRPDFAVELLESVKHYMDDERITFVFSINKQELQHTIKKYYGEGFNACRYLDRFFDFQVVLPPINNDNFIDFIPSMNSFNAILKESCKRIIEVNGFQMRETFHFLQKVDIAVARATEKFFSGTISPLHKRVVMLLYIVPVLIGLQMTDKTRYEKFIMGEDEKTFVNTFIEGAAGDNLLGHLIDKNEGLVIKNKDDDHRIKEQRFKECYNALFVNQYSNSFEHNVGPCTFYKEDKRLVLKAASMLSEFSNFDDR